MDKLTKEAAGELIFGGHLEYFYQSCLYDDVKMIRKDLLTNDRLEEPQRRANVLILRLLKNAFLQAYANTSSAVPLWVERELG